MVGFIDEIEIRLSPIVEGARVRTPLIKVRGYVHL